MYVPAITDRDVAAGTTTTDSANACPNAERTVQHTVTHATATPVATTTAKTTSHFTATGSD